MANNHRDDDDDDDIIATSLAQFTNAFWQECIIDDDQNAGSSQQQAPRSATAGQGSAQQPEILLQSRQPGSHEMSAPAANIPDAAVLAAIQAPRGSEQFLPSQQHGSTATMQHTNSNTNPEPQYLPAGHLGMATAVTGFQQFQASQQPSSQIQLVTIDNVQYVVLGDTLVPVTSGPLPSPARSEQGISSADTRIGDMPPPMRPQQHTVIGPGGQQPTVVLLGAQSAPVTPMRGAEQQAIPQAQAVYQLRHHVPPGNSGSMSVDSGLRRPPPPYGVGQHPVYQDLATRDRMSNTEQLLGHRVPAASPQQGTGSNRLVTPTQIRAEMRRKALEKMRRMEESGEM